MNRQLDWIAGTYACPKGGCLDLRRIGSPEEYCTFRYEHRNCIDPMKEKLNDRMPEVHILEEREYNGFAEDLNEQSLKILAQAKLEEGEPIKLPYAIPKLTIWQKVKIILNVCLRRFRR